MKLEKTLIEMVGHFTPSRASDWLRFLFSSFETDTEPIAVDTTKNESAYFAEARRLGWAETLQASATSFSLIVLISYFPVTSGLCNRLHMHIIANSGYCQCIF